MKLRVLITAVLAAALAIPAWAATRFPDVPDSHPRSGDIQFVASQSPAWFGGYPDGSFKPDRTINAKQMAAVIGRAFPDGMTRAEFASFLRGGADRVAATPTTTAPPSPAADLWEDRGVTSCPGMYADMVADSTGSYNFNPDEYDPDRDVEGTARFGSYVSVDILRVTGWHNRFVTPTFYMCEGEAKLDNGRKLKIVIWTVIDTDGDLFHNYGYPSADRPSCAEAKAAGLDLLDYNFSWYYGQSNDPDRDGVMCEDVLPEHPQNIIGDPSGRGV